MSQFFCHHPEFGHGGWGHPRPEEAPYPHACCIICCPHADREQRISYGRRAEVRWIFLPEGSTLADVIEMGVADEDKPGPDEQFVVLSNWSDQRLYNVLGFNNEALRLVEADNETARREAQRLADRDARIRAAERRRGKPSD